MSTHETSQDETEQSRGPVIAVAVVAWLWVAIPFGYGIAQLIVKIPALVAG